MKEHMVQPSDSHILIVDDDTVICDVLTRLLQKSYKVTACLNGREAITEIEKQHFDVVITDLKMPEVSGLDILEAAKEKDQYTEVIIMTGYGSFDSATDAINKGVNSYLLKPLQMPEFLSKVEKAVAARLFHLRSLKLMYQSEELSPDIQSHVKEITSLYAVIHKLMLSLEITDIMRVALDEVLCRTGAPLAVICIVYPDIHEIYAMPAKGSIDTERFPRLLNRHRDSLFPDIVCSSTQITATPFFFKGRDGPSLDLNNVESVSVPMMVAERTFGMLMLFVPRIAEQLKYDTNYLYVFSSIVSPVIDHGYTTRQARIQAKTDALTGISNHRFFHEALDREISRADRRKGTFALVMFDIDDFKKINDTYGHQVGDAVLIDLTKKITSMIRTGDIFARYGGEEFILILSDTDLRGAEMSVSRILHTIDTSFFSNDQKQIHYTVSSGLILYDGAHPAQKDLLITAVDDALYQSKEHGKNRLSIGTVSL